MRPRRILRLSIPAGVVVAVAVLLSATPAGAHGLGDARETGVPTWLFAWFAVLAIGLTTILLAWWWPHPRLDRWSEGREMGPFADRLVQPVGRLLRLVGLAAFALVLVSAIAGSRITVLNIAPFALYVAFWVGLQLASALMGDVYRMLSPYQTAARLLPDRWWSERMPTGVDALPWTAAPLLFSFVWLELAYFEPGAPRAIGVWLIAYTVVIAIGIGVGGPRWPRTNDGFAALFGALSRMAPVTILDGRVRVRWPGSGLGRMPLRDATLAVLVVALGSTAFDGLRDTGMWGRIRGSSTGWPLTAIDTLGLLAVILVVWLVWVAGVRHAARTSGVDLVVLRRQLLPALVPLVLGYTLAHYTSVLAIESQDLYALASDPLGRGWDLFGTRGHAVDERAISPTVLGWVQHGALVLAGVTSTIVVHDRLLVSLDGRRVPRARSAMALVVATLTVAGLFLAEGG